MFFIRQIIFILLIFSGAHCFGQIPKHLFNEITGEAYRVKEFTSNAKPLRQRMGVYHFGESEGEWDFVIIPHNDSLIIQIWNGAWATNLYTKKQCWQMQCKTYNKVSVQGNKIYFGSYSGLFAEYRFENKATNALLLFCDPIEERNYGRDSAEVGHYSTSIDTFYDDRERYQLSVKVQPEVFFKSKTKQDLKIMRNTIYANYGLIFQAGGEMEKYFKKKSWYNPFQKDVSNCLTDIERMNIQTMGKFEQMPE